MGCGSCGTGKDGAPGGCGSHGSCSSGGCNRMNVHDWLANLPFADPESSCKIVEVSFNNGSRKDYFKNPSTNFYEKGDLIAVEGVSGFDVGSVNLTGELVRLQLKKNNIKEDSADIKRILRRANETDLTKLKETKARERDVMIRSRAIAKQLNLQMKVAEVEIQADGRKATFFYIADDRVDFRELIKIYASEFKVKVEMKQIGARQEAGKVGGIGSCGRELCCSTWLTDFKSVNTNAARYQNLSINQTKLSGQCGRLKCCLNYELDTYLDALQNFPDDCDMIEVARSRAFLVKKDIFRNLMWYTMPDSNKQYPLTIERVLKIKALNKQGIKPEELETVEVVSKKPVEVEPTYADVVGQISLRSLEKTSRRRRDNERGGENRQGGNKQRGNEQRPQQGGPQQNRPQQANRPQGGPQQNRGGENRQGGNRQRGNEQRPQQGGSQQNRPPQANRPQGGPQQNRGGQNQQRPNNPQQGNRQGQPQNRPPQKPDQGPANTGGENK
ncbi:regulatory iron-sulfur-containing complex subunit RicT [Ferruginibacter sp. SUN002]|uniref:regulatory iron-sulfur-containing complex subunit RicT n=1 Tax=Ferruginibacter sp. SUN002 TaxID=2937789 RepID=UPI003D36AD55